MLLILRHERLDLGKFPDRMTNWFGVTSRQWRAALTTGVGLKRNDLVALFRRNQFSLVLLMSFLPAAFSLLAISLGTLQFGMRMLRARRLRGVLRRLAQLRLQLGKPRQQ